MRISRDPVDVAQARQQIAQGGTKQSKYRAVKVRIDGEWFDSKAEARRWQELKILARCNVIAWAIRQVPFDLLANGHVIGRYIADFEIAKRDGELIVEDVKGIVTPLAAWKLKHFEAQYGFPVTIKRMK